MTQGKTFHIHRNHLIPYYLKVLWLFPHIQIYNEQNPEIFHDSDRSDIIQNDLYTSYDLSEFDDSVFDDDPLPNDNDDISIMFDNELYKSVNFDDDNYRPSRWKCDSEELYNIPRSSKFQSFNKFPELFDLPDTGTVCDSPP